MIKPLKGGTPGELRMAVELLIAQHNALCEHLGVDLGEVDPAVGAEARQRLGSKTYERPQLPHFTVNMMPTASDLNMIPNALVNIFQRLEALE